MLGEYRNFKVKGKKKEFKLAHLTFESDEVGRYDTIQDYKKRGYYVRSVLGEKTPYGRVVGIYVYKPKNRERRSEVYVHSHTRKVKKR